MFHSTKSLILPEEVSGELQILAANDDNLCAVQDLLGDNGCETAEQVTATVDDDSLKSET